MIVLEVAANRRIETGLAPALATQILVPATHTVHVRRRSTQIRNVAAKRRHGTQLLDFTNNRSLGTRLDEFALMGGNSAEIAAPETTAVRNDAVLDHIVRRNPLVLVAGMRELGKRQVPVRVHFFCSRWRKWRIDLDISLTYRL